MINALLKIFSATRCESEFLTFPAWHRGLFKDVDCQIVINKLSDVWTIIANIADILIHVAGLLAVVFIIYGGIRYITSQGEPENLQSAKKILTNAIVGLILAILASTIVGFIAGSLS